MRYTCNILIQYSDRDGFSFFQNAINFLGFRPLYFDVFFDEFKRPKDDLEYDVQIMLEFLKVKSKPGSITIKSDLYGEDKSSYEWFRYTLNIDENTNESIGRTCRFEWSNSINLDFLLNSDLFNSFIKSEYLIYCYCYNQTDVAEQSRNSYDEDTEENKNLITRIDVFGKKIIDTSQHWGRIERVRSIYFVAAANMWFGKRFDPVFSLEKMSKFKYSKPNIYSADLVYIELFKLYDDPSKKINREKQKEFWLFLNANKIISNYENNNQFDFVDWLKKRAKKNKRK